MRSSCERLCTALAMVAVLFGISGPAAAQPAAERAIERARAFLGGNPGAVQGGPGQAYAVREVVIDADGSEHVRFDRTFQGLRVLGGDFVLHHDGRGAFEGVSLTLGRAPAVSVRPTLAAAEAARLASEAFGSGGTVGAVDLVIEADAGSSLAYEVVVQGRRDDRTPSERHFVVDAHSGRVIDSWDAVQTDVSAGTGHGFHDGLVTLTTNSLSSGFELRDPTRGNQATTDMNDSTAGLGTTFTNPDNVSWGGVGSLSNRQSVGVDAQYGAAETWDYYRLVHGRAGIRNDGVGALSRVHYDVGYVNAFWSDSCFCMTYGDGDGFFYLPFAALDVAGHEMTHGVTSATAGLRYSGEPGGLNEATSDIFGTMVEYRTNNANDAPDYLIGEKLFDPEVWGATQAIRAMFWPELDGASPNCYSRFLKTLDVHYSSGVANHFFYLLAEGSAPGPSNTIDGVAYGSPTCDGSAITGIGRDKAERIWYRALTVYLTVKSTYSNARTATLNAARDLFGGPSRSTNTDEYRAVVAAWKAVNVVK